MSADNRIGKSEPTHCEPGEPKEPFREAECIVFSLRTFIPTFNWMAEASGFEATYLGPEVTQDEHDIFPFIESVSARIRDRLTVLIDAHQANPLTTDDLASLEAQAYQAALQIGTVIYERSQDMGLVNTIPAATLEDIVDDPQRLEYARNRNWHIYPAKNGHHIFVHSSADTLDLIDLDDLFTKDPEFLKAQILTYHEHDGFSSAMFHARFNIALHGLDTQDFIPPLFSNFSQDRNLRNAQVHDILTFLQWMGNLDPNFTERINRFISSFHQPPTAQLPALYNSTVFPHTYLDHLAACPGESAANSTRFLAMARPYEIFRHLRYISEPPYYEKGSSPKANLRRLLRNPLLYTDNYRAQWAEEVVLERTQYQAMADFITATRDVANPQNFLQALEKHLPHVAKLVEEFRQGLGTFRTQRYNQIVEHSATDLHLISTPISLETVTNIITKNLGLQTTRTDRDKSLYIYESDSHGISITNDFLRDTLILLVIKATQRSLKESENHHPVLQDTHDSKHQALDQMIDSLVASYQGKVKSSATRLKEVTRYGRALSRFATQTGISLEKINRLAQIAQGGRKRSLFDVRPHYDLAIALNLLYLNSRGELDLNSPPLKTIVQELFGIKDSLFDTLLEN